MTTSALLIRCLLCRGGLGWPAWGVALLLLLVGRGQPLAAQETLYQEVLPSCVEVLVDGQHAGSGWIADPAGLVFTAGHAFTRPDQVVEVLWRDGRRSPATLLGIDRGHDAALLSLEEREGGYPSVPFSQTSPLAGDNLMLVGAPSFRPSLMIAGVVSSDETSYEYYGPTLGYVEIIHLSADVLQGTSGGPWFNSEGEVVGLQSSSLSVSLNRDFPNAIAQMAPASALRELLAAQANRPTPSLGLAVEGMWQHPLGVRQRYPAEVEGLLVTEIREGGPATVAGLQVGDLVLAVEGEAVRRPTQLMQVVRQHQAEETLTLQVYSLSTATSREVLLTVDSLEPSWP